MSFTAIYYTDNRLPVDLWQVTLHHLNRALCHASEPGLAPPQVLAMVQGQTSLIPEWWAQHTVTGERGLHDCYMKIMAALEMAEFPQVWLLEHDVLYPLSYFDYVLDTSVRCFWFDVNNWVQCEHGFFARNRCLTSCCTARRDLLRDSFATKLGMISRGERITWDEPGGMQEVPDCPMVRRKGNQPVIDIRHGHNLTGQRYSGREGYRDKLAPWGSHRELWESYGLEVHNDAWRMHWRNSQKREVKP